MTYPEALRWLANKYHIEIKERELTDDEKREQSERESMFIINEWASGYFEDILHNNVDGVAIGMQYFRTRGFRDDIIRKFKLGFDLPDRLTLGRTARQKGFQDEYLLKTGICYRNERGELVDRYSGRVIFPWIGISGKVVGLGVACSMHAQKASIRSMSTRQTVTSITKIMSFTASIRPRKRLQKKTVSTWLKATRM